MHRLAVYIALPLALLFAGCQPDTKSEGEKKAERPHPVEAASVTFGATGFELERLGTLRADREVKVVTREEGRLATLAVRAGEQVEKGDLLLRLDDQLLRAELKKATAGRSQAELDVQRLEKLRGGRIISEEELARARTALEVALAEEDLLKIRLGYTEVRAPFSGAISARLAEPGDVVPRLAHVLTLTDTSELVTEVKVSELLLPEITAGEQVEVRIDALGSARHPGKVVRIHPRIDPVTRQGTVEVVLSPPPPGARPGQSCRVLLAGRAQPRLTIPFAALRRGEGEYVFVIDEGHAQSHPVTTGLQLGERVELLDGPGEGTPVVIKGFMGLTDGTPVEVVGGPGATP